MRIFYIIFILSMVLLSNLFRDHPAELKAPGGDVFSESRKLAHYFSMAVIATISLWLSVIQLKRDWFAFKKRIKKRKQ